MTFEDVVYSRLCEAGNLAECLAVYGERPAVFYQSAPDDTATGWNGRRQYPRIVYVTDYVSVPERGTSGTLTLDILCAEDGMPPEEIEPHVRGALCGIFVTPDDAPPISLSWARSDAFEQARGAGGDGIVIGITVAFDLYAFPSQISCDPDPVLAMNRFVRRVIPDAEIVGGMKPTDRVFVPTPQTPAVYFRLESTQTVRETNTAVWLDGTVLGHIFAGGGEWAWISYLADVLATEGEVEMLDTSPMFMRSVRADNSLDALSAGQLRLTVRFGILRRPGYHHPLIHPYGNTKPLVPEEAIQS